MPRFNLNLTIPKLLAFTLLFTLCNCSRKHHTETDTIGYAGKARVNPYLAAQQFINSGNYSSIDGKVKEHYGGVYDDETSFIVSPASSLESSRTTQRLLNWVENGGVYLCLLERGEKKWKDVGENCNHQSDKWDDLNMLLLATNDITPNEGRDYLLDSLNVTLEKKDPSGTCTGGRDYSNDPHNPVVMGTELPLTEDTKILMKGKPLTVKLGGNYIMQYNGQDPPLLADEHKDYNRFLCLSHGNGYIYLVTDARFLRNPYLNMADHAELLNQMCLISPPGEMKFLYGQKITFWQLVIKHAALIALGLFILLTLWLWKVIPQRGNLIDTVDEINKSRTQTLLNSGNFLWRYNATNPLLRPLRDRAIKESGALQDDGQIEPDIIKKISTETSLSTEETIEALSDNSSKIKETELVRITRNLQKILNHYE